MDRTTAKALAPAPLKEREVRSIILGIMLAMLLAALEQTIVATALPTIGRDLGDLDLLPWVATAYLLTATAATPLYGKLANIRGRRLALLIAIAVFAAGSVACAVAPTMLLLVAARAVQGLGGGGLIALAQTIIADVVPPKERPRYQVYIAGTFTTSSLLGPVLGGVMAEHLHWSAIFWINLPLGLAAYGMTDSALRRLPRHDQPRRLDLVAAALLIAATTTLLLALSGGGTRYPWISGPIGALVAASALLWAAFGWRLLRRRSPDPARGAAQPRGARGNACGQLRHGHLHRADHLHPALLRGGFGADRGLVRTAVRHGEQARLDVHPVERRCRKPYPEPRYRVLGIINNEVFAVVIAFESGEVRVISLRKANRKGRAYGTQAGPTHDR